MLRTKTHDLKDKRILLTGASSGIGRALVLALAPHQVHMVLVARRASLLEQLADEIVALGGKRPVILCADLSQSGVAKSIAEQALHALGSIDILINNAGTSIIGAQYVVGDDIAARAVFETNFWTPLALTHALVPQMRSQGYGLIVNVTSTLQAVPMPLLGTYCASKTALARATQVLRHELSHSPVHVLEVIPGGTDTPTRQNDQFLPLRKGPLRAPKLVSPESTAQAVIRAIQNGKDRVIHPRYAMIPIELSIFGRLVGHIAARGIDTDSEQVINPDIAKHILLDKPIQDSSRI
ncbi:SDR family NAD(P)-dependent oxidoreductase [Aquirhabdus sp.]|uniref:SDR family NAD(P)-dependent oxidoreductase n=1 Tax=Aquirhabdus sp. TaxID=2824160 RepID=UPI00396CA735